LFAPEIVLLFVSSIVVSLVPMVDREPDQVSKHACSTVCSRDCCFVCSSNSSIGCPMVVVLLLLSSLLS
jgi:hypothetical protein